MNSKKVERIDSWVIAIFIAESSICTSINAFISIPFLSVFLMLLLLLVVFISHYGKIRVNRKCFFAYILVGTVLLLSALLNGMENTYNYIFHFLVFTSTALVLVSLNLNYKEIISNVIVVYFIIILIYFLKFRDAFKNSVDYWRSQMGVAYGFVIPVLFSFVFILFYKKYFKDSKKIVKVFAVVDLLASFFIIFYDCGTRGAILSIIIGCGITIIGLVNTRRSLLLILFLVVLMVVLYLRIDILIEWLAIFFSDSRIIALQKNSQFISSNSVDNGRLAYYYDAWRSFGDSPIVGNGVGYFENNHNGAYVHGIVLEILCEFGLIGFAAICFLIVRILKKVKNSNDTGESILVLLLLGISVILLFSSSYWLLTYFWFGVFILLKDKRKEEIIVYG